MPHEGQKHGRILRDVGCAGALVHGRRAGEEGVDVKALQRHR